MEIRLLGPLEVAVDDRPVTLPRGRIRSLLALLALQPQQVVATDRLDGLPHGLEGHADPLCSLSSDLGTRAAARGRLSGESCLASQTLPLPSCR